ncbi:FAD/NAD(P)-binding protein [Portibacter lacus]|uniref:FAD-dependent urate hydroxylase HpyO/Asp monooxygenase CreE-like FAD/NAD(P)-binding domain-containing protein n=1 Tax=Portibacter lacus TaxID=1099794 RepID=A0AA37WEM9_9BACT|nr:FAD/NAD(P)-binding protein [Portibacter lacus]GLR17998.1 hypothetical protein GCM10007940_26130 [Portibacter lacus]
MQHNSSISKYNIAIIGLGPKGLYAFAELTKFLLSRNIKEVNVYLFDKSGQFGTGPVYNLDQPKYLLMNYENVHIDHSSLYISDDRRKTYNQIAEPKEHFSSRGEIGRYLLDLYNDLKIQSLGCFNIQEVKDAVTNIKKSEDKLFLETANAEFDHIAFDQVMITSGHNTCNACKQTFDQMINFVYPPEQKLKSIAKEDVVIVKGLGLTFIDTVLGLTEGRDGRFTADGQKLKYIKSGNEPKTIIPFSRTGELMLPRMETKLPPNFRLRSKSLNQIAKNRKGQLDFEEDILPALEDEFAQQGGKGKFVDAASLSDFTIDELVNIAEGNSFSEKIVASLIWRLFSTAFNKIYSNRGLNPSAHRQFDQYWKGKMQRVSYGPPLINYKKIQAVYEAGILDFAFSKSPSIDFERKKITNHDGQSSTSFTYLVDARIPSNNILNNPSELYRNMLNSGLIRTARNGDYDMGCIDLDSDGHGVSEDGMVISQLTFYGIPTEGITYNNDTLSTNHNNYAINWIKEIQKDFEYEHYKINSDSSQLGPKLKVSA